MAFRWRTSGLGLYNLIEWISAQHWCDSIVGMIGISAFDGSQFNAAFQQSPHLKA